MPKPRVLQKYEVDESRCILCGICVDACPYDAAALRRPVRACARQPRGADDRPPRVAMERETEMSYIRRERDWAERARAEGRVLEPSRLLPVLPSSLANGHGNGNGHTHAGNGNGNGHTHAHDR
jgi:ferredoxin